MALGLGTALVVAGLVVFFLTGAYSMASGNDALDTVGMALYGGAVALFGATVVFLDPESTLSYALAAAGWLCLLGGIYRQFGEALRERRRGDAA